MKPICPVLLEQKNEEFSPFDVLVYGFEQNADLLKIASNLREAGIKAVVEFKNKKLKKALDYANNQNVPFVAILGEDEIKENKIMLKNMKEGTQEKLSLEEAVEKINKGK